MKETIIQEPFELKFFSDAFTIMNGQKAFQTEELVKINDEGDLAFLKLTVPANLALEKTFKITITSCNDLILNDDCHNIAHLNN